MSPLATILDTLPHPRILVIGDLILDRYTFGNAERVSPEAPVVVLRVDEREIRPGGAASVAMLLRALEAEVVLAGVIGDDQEGHTLRSLLADHRIDGGTIITDTERPTTTKERVIGRAAGRHGNQIVRVDHECREPLSPSTEDALIMLILFELSDFQAIVISDYAKGVCTPKLLQTIICAGKELGIPVIVDPARIADYERYRGAALLKPNRFEAEFATGRKIVTPDDALTSGKDLCDRFEIKSVLVTLDSDGMALVETASCRTCPSPSSTLDSPPSLSLHLPITPHEVYDITGAGDMVLATLGLCIASAVPVPQAAQLANNSAGLEVEKLGVAPVTRAELRHALTELNTSSNSKSEISFPKSSSKLTSLAALLPVMAAYRASGKSMVFTNGCFDLLHVGHVTYLQEAAALGDVLIVAVNSDSSVRTLKGESRPVIPERDRARMLAFLNCVTHVLIFDDLTPHRLLSALSPDVLAKGGTTAEIVGHEIVEIYGGRVIRLPEIPGNSTTAILSRVQDLRFDEPKVEAASGRFQTSNPKSEIPIPK